MQLLLAVLALAVTVGAQTASAPTAPHPEPELGKVAWSRDFDAALACAERESKPVLLLFQEIPGCDTCTGFGRDVLSHPMLVPAIETCFVPVVVRNNVEGKEREILKRYEEPAWNNPVVRFLDAKGKDLIARKDRVWDAHKMAARMISALEKAHATVPGYLRIARDESDHATETAVFEMHCFWEGEAHFGAMPGVVGTRAAFVGEAEVVEVTFLPALVAEKELTALASAKSCKAVSVKNVREAPAADQKHALIGTPYEKLALTPMQRMRVHSDLTLGSDPKRWLTPAQLLQLRLK